MIVWATHLSVQNKRSPEQFVPQKICSMPCINTLPLSHLQYCMQHICHCRDIAHPWISCSKNDTLLAVVDNKGVWCLQV